MAHRRDCQIDLVIGDHRDPVCRVDPRELDSDAELAGYGLRYIDFVTLSGLARAGAEQRIMIAYPNADAARAQDADQAVDARLTALARHRGLRLPEQPLQGGVGRMTLLGVYRRSGEHAGRNCQAAANFPDRSERGAG